MAAGGDIRAFVAIDMPDDAREALEQLQDDLPVGRLMDPETFHLTLAFLGDQPNEVMEAVHQGLSDLKVEPIDLCLRGVDVFGSKAPKLLYAGADATPSLVGLRDKVRRAVVHAGVELPRERFRPHVTLARFRGRPRGDELEKLRGFLAFHAGFTLPPFQVRQFTLYRSHLHGDGAVHEVLAEYPLEA